MAFVGKENAVFARLSPVLFSIQKNFYGLDGPIGLASDHLAALRRCAKELCATCAEYTDLLFLTSFDLESLFPYFALKDIAKQRLHLWCAPPLDFFGKHISTPILKWRSRSAMKSRFFVST